LKKALKSKSLDRKFAFSRAKNGYLVKSDIKFEDVNVDDFDALVIPGGYAPDRIRRSKVAVELTRKFYELGKLLLLFVMLAGFQYLLEF
jgi:protease I